MFCLRLILRLKLREVGSQSSLWELTSVHNVYYAVDTV